MKILLSDIQEDIFGIFTPNHKILIIKHPLEKPTIPFFKHPIKSFSCYFFNPSNYFRFHDANRKGVICCCPCERVQHVLGAVYLVRVQDPGGHQEGQAPQPVLPREYHAGRFIWRKKCAIFKFLFSVYVMVNNFLIFSL